MLSSTHKRSLDPSASKVNYWQIPHSVSNQVRNWIEGAFNGDTLAYQKLWQLTPFGFKRLPSPLHEKVKQESHALAQAFIQPPALRIDCFSGHWSSGALSLVKDKQVKIFHGDFRDEHGTHITGHELFHYYLRTRLDKDLINSGAEECFVQYMTFWELPAKLKQKNSWLLHHCHKLYLLKAWTDLNRSLRILNCCL